MNIFLLIYLIGLAITVVHATILNGRELAYLKVLAPQNLMTPNWTNFFFMGVLWFAYWPQYASSRRVAASMPTDPRRRHQYAAKAMGLPVENVSG